MDKFFKFYKKYGIFVVLVVLFAFFSIAAEGFLNTPSLMNILRQSVVYGVMVVGVTIVMISGGTDLSVGGQVACNGLLIAYMLTHGVPIPVAILIGIVSGMAFGVLTGTLIASLKVAPLVVTLCFMLILNGIAVVVSGGYPIYDMPKSFLFIGQGNIGSVFPFSVLILALAVLIGWFILHKTYFGRQIYALGGNQGAARLAGINVFKVRVFTYMISGGFIALGCIMLLARTNSATPTAGATYPFDCMTACVLGGVSWGGGSGNIITTMLGVVIIAMIGVGLLLMGFDSNFQQIIKGLILLMALSIDAIQRNKAEKA
ncbi:MAG: ABC transporter permease [Lachnospiraceae bacterium]|nr:ABC transporter permease [Lachnospiraceae bacterium]